MYGDVVAAVESVDLSAVLIVLVVLFVDPSVVTVDFSVLAVDLSVVFLVLAVLFVDPSVVVVDVTAEIIGDRAAAVVADPSAVFK